MHSVDWMFIIGVTAWQWLGEYVTHLLTSSMVQSPSWQANWFATRQEIPRISRNPKVHYRTHKRPPPVSILGQPNPVYIPISHLLEIHPNITIYINNKNSIINNNYGRFRDFILLLKIVTVTRKIFLEIYRQFGSASSKKFASPGLSNTKGLSKVYVYRDRNSLNLLSVLFYSGPLVQQRRF